jgi:hypothetical protein
MISTSRLTLSALGAAIPVAPSLSATTPALARSGGWLFHESTEFMMKNGAHYCINTQHKAWEGRSRPTWNATAG